MIFAEPYCGTAALTYYLLGNGAKPPLSYQGGKASLAPAIARVMDEALGSRPEYTGAYLYDANVLWPITHTALADPERRPCLAAYLEELAEQDARTLYDNMRRPMGHNPAHTVEQFLFLQRLAFGGKAVFLDSDSRWRTPGFNKTSAYGVAATATCGAFKPLVPGLIKRIRALPWLPLVTSSFEGDVVEYLDPPYEGTTGYHHKSDRATVVCRAINGSRAGRAVFVSEAEPIAELVDQGWRATQVRAPDTTKKSLRHKKPEWLTWRVP